MLTASFSAKAEITYTASLGVGVSQEYQGSRVYHAAPEIALRADFGNGWFVDTAQGAGYATTFSNSMFASAVLAYDGGRKEKQSYNTPGNDYLKGMGDISGSVLGVITVGMPIYGKTTTSLTLELPLTHSERGVAGHVDLTVPVFDQGAHKITITPSVHFGSSKYTQSFFGVTAQQAANTTFNAYSTHAGVDSTSVSAAWSYTITPNWSTHTELGVSRLLGDAAGSPIVQKKQGFFAMSVVSYTF